MECAFSRLKRALGSRLQSRSPVAPQIEAVIAMRVLNRMVELGMPLARRVC